MVKNITTIALLLASNVFMTLAWYGHLKYKSLGNKMASWGMLGIILISWGIAFLNIA